MDYLFNQQKMDLLRYFGDINGMVAVFLFVVLARLSLYPCLCVITCILRPIGIIIRYLTDSRYVQTTFIDAFASDVLPDYRQMVKDNSTLSWIKHGSPRNHSHPNAAQSRCKANIMMSNIITSLGMTRYSVSMSPSEKRIAMAGDRFYHHVKDLQMNSQYGNPAPGQIITLTDVDYYVDMPALLLKGLPVLAYSFVPTAVAGKTENGVYKTNSRNNIEMLIDGGANYEHPLWDYDGDHLVVHSLYYSVVYLLEQLHITSDRRVIFFNPIRTIYAPANWIIKGKGLKRRQLVSNGVALSQYLTHEKDGSTSAMFSFAKVDTFDAVNLRSNVLAASVIRAREAKTPHISDIERIFNTYEIPDPVFSAALFLDMFKTSPEIFNVKTSNVSPCVVQRDAHTYQAVGPLVTEDGTASMRAIWPGYCRNTFSPAKSYNNDKACIEGRILEPRNREPTLPPIIQQYIEEFLVRLVPDRLAGSLSPSDYDQMEEQFDRPTQRALLERAKDFMFGKNVIRSFQKAEAYPKITHPRNITTCSMAHNFVMGQFGVPFVKKVMKECHWYAFGNHPTIISQRLQEKARKATYSVNTDANKLDGSVYFFFRDLVVAAVKRAYAPTYRAEIHRAELKERNLKGKTSHGVSYDAKCTVLSGSSWTSVFGTLTNGFINYVALRNYHDADQAWKHMGIYGGDDGITFDLPANAVKKTAAMFGMAFDAEAVPVSMPVKFLGRIYPDLLTTTASICDVARQARKLHLTATNDFIPTHLALYRKAQGYRVTDSDTPFITPWCDAVLRICGPETVNHRLYAQTLGESSYWSKFECPFDTLTDDVYKYTIVSHELGLTVTEIKKYEDIFRSAEKLEDLYLDDILKLKTSTSVKATINGYIVTPSKRKTIPEIVDEHAQLRVRVCRFVERGQKCSRTDCKFAHEFPANGGTTPVNRSVNSRVVPTQSGARPTSCRRPRDGKDRPAKAKTTVAPTQVKTTTAAKCDNKPNPDPIVKLQRGHRAPPTANPVKPPAKPSSPAIITAGPTPNIS